MWRCLNCKSFKYSPFHYYGGYTGYDPESLSCLKGHFYMTDMEPDTLRAANATGDSCDDFERGKPQEDK